MQSLFNFARDTSANKPNAQNENENENSKIYQDATNKKNEPLSKKQILNIGSV